MAGRPGSRSRCTFTRRSDRCRRCSSTALESRVYIVRANFASPRNPGTSSIINDEGQTVRQLGSGAWVLVGDIDLTTLRKTRAAWNPVYGLPYRYPPAYKRLRGNAAGPAKP